MAVVALLAMSACYVTSSGSTGGELTVGSGLSFMNEITVVFEGVSQDSRCPEGVQCVRAGEALVDLSLQARGELEDRQVQLVIAPGGSASTRFAGFMVTLTALEPDPPPQRTAGEAIDYVAHIEIEESDQ